MEKTAEQIKAFLQYIAVKLIKYPQDAQLKFAEVDTNHYRYRLILNQADVALLIGRNGYNASAVRSILKAAAQRDGISATLQIISQEEEQERLVNASK